MISRFFKVSSLSSSALSPGFTGHAIFLTLLLLLTYSLAPTEMLGISEGTPFSPLVINEIMKNPVSVTDSHGEYIELFNPNSYDIEINDWVMVDLGGDYHRIESSEPLIVEPLSYFVLARDTSSATNGGFHADYQYSSFTLSNGADEVILANASGAVVDSIVYDSDQFPLEAGCAMELRNQFFNNIHGYNWNDSATPFGLGDSGTPGSQNSAWEGYKEMTLDVDVDTLRVSQGGSTQLGFYVTSQTDGEVNALLRGDLYMPDGNPYPNNPLFGPAILSFESGERWEKTLSIDVPERAEAGYYRLIGRLMDGADEEMDREEVVIGVATDDADIKQSFGCDGD